MCIGNRLALLEMKATMVSVVKNYTIDKTIDTPVSTIIMICKGNSRNILKVWGTNTSSPGTYIYENPNPCLALSMNFNFLNLFIFGGSHICWSFLSLLAKIKVLGVLPAHLPLVLHAGILISVPPLCCAGFVCCHCTGRWAVLDDTHGKDSGAFRWVQPLPWPLLLVNRRSPIC